MRIVRDDRPDILTYAILSAHVYSKRLGDPLPLGWEISLKPREEYCKSGYFGVLYKNPAGKHYVLANQGTESLKDVFTDIRTIIRNKNDAQLRSLYSFLYDVLKKVMETEGAGLSLTGHSLGGWLSEVAMCWCKNNTYARDDFSGFYLDVTATVFDSPGGREAAEYYQPQSNITQWDVMNILSDPSLINSANHHLGVLYHLPRYIEESSGGAVPRGVIKKHRILGMIKSLEQIREGGKVPYAGLKPMSSWVHNEGLLFRKNKRHQKFDRHSERSMESGCVEVRRELSLDAEHALRRVGYAPRVYAIVSSDIMPHTQYVLDFRHFQLNYGFFLARFYISRVENSEGMKEKLKKLGFSRHAQKILMSYHLYAFNSQVFQPYDKLISFESIRANGILVLNQEVVDDDENVFTFRYEISEHLANVSEEDINKFMTSITTQTSEDRLEASSHETGIVVHAGRDTTFHRETDRGVTLVAEEAALERGVTAIDKLREGQRRDDFTLAGVEIRAERDANVTWKENFGINLQITRKDVVSQEEVVMPATTEVRRPQTPITMVRRLNAVETRQINVGNHSAQVNIEDYYTPQIAPLVTPSIKGNYKLNQSQHVVKDFIGRQEEFRQLHDQIVQARFSVIMSSVMKEGAGKSTLANRFANQMQAQNEYDYIAWLNASSAQSLSQDMLMIIREHERLYFPRQERVYETTQSLTASFYDELLCRMPGYERTLLIFDNLPSLSFFPDLPRGSSSFDPIKHDLNVASRENRKLDWIITTSDQSRYSQPENQYIQLHPFTLEESTYYLRRYLTIAITPTECEQIFSLLKGHPKALNLATITLNRRIIATSGQEYVQFFEQEQRTLRKALIDDFTPLSEAEQILLIAKRLNNPMLTA